MQKRLIKHGNSLALVVDRATLDLLNIDENTPLDISTDGKSLLVSPAPIAKRRKHFKQALAATNKRYGRALKRLAE